MRIAYLTTDEVNESLAVQLAGADGITVEAVSPRDEPLDGRFDAVVYDLDFLPAQQRQVILARLASGVSLRPVGVHSYNLDKDTARALRKHRVAVHPRLEGKLFQKLLCIVVQRERQFTLSGAETR